MASEASVERGGAVHPAPRVSVVIPAWRPTALEAALASVRAQTFGDWELILVDDGSPEPVRPERVDDLVLVRQANGGPGAARNTGLALARGELVAFLDSDDRWRPEKLARQVALHQRRPDCVLSTTDVALVTPAGRELQRASRRYGYQGETIGYEQLFAENCITTSAAMVRREAVAATPGFDPARRAAEDYYLWLRLGRLGSIGYVDQVLTEHVEHAESLTAEELRAGSWHEAELGVYRELLAEWPDLAREPYVAAALARAEADAGYGALARGDWAAARAAYRRSLRHQPARLRTWMNWVRAVLHVGPRRK